MTDTNNNEELMQSIEEDYERINKELSFLFGKEIVDQVRQIDIADLNFNDEMTGTISAGIRQLKKLKHDPNAQKDLVTEMEPGTRLVLCMWIMDMGLLEKIQTRSYFI